MESAGGYIRLDFGNILASPIDVIYTLIYHVEREHLTSAHHVIHRARNRFASGVSLSHRCPFLPALSC